MRTTRRPPRVKSPVPEVVASAPTSTKAPTTAPEGIVVVDKPAGWTSHDVVGRMRRLAGTRRVGHAGTLDPMATGVLVVGLGRATRLLGHISGSDKTYTATIRLGWATVTDDAEGARLEGAPADGLPTEAIMAGVAALTGPIMQRPSSVSAIKVEGRRSHDRVRAGEDVELPERPVVVSQFDVLDVRRDEGLACTDLDVEVTCSSGTYVRALARDLGASLGVGGHLTSLRRSRVGIFDAAQSRTLDALAKVLDVTDLAAAARAAFPSVTLTAADANAVRYGRSIELGLAWSRAKDPAGVVEFQTNADALDAVHEGTADWTEKPTPAHALFAADGEFLALAEPKPDGTAKYLAVFSQP